ncbi:MAG TPA: hydrogenase maturation nickel metallochaperone HypA [Caulobacteraceae bacterium]|jgi:hydrogenase nickel incorporation protein HypA/HybF|nr:hydrogenase maturation nickel metallochaperone HypA [Caulobacteraceae bacterium]
MHELAIAEAIVDRVAETAAGRRVVRVTVEIGDQTCVSCEALAFSFGLVAEGTGVHGAELVTRLVPGDALNVKSLEIEEAA